MHAEISRRMAEQTTVNAMMEGFVHMYAMDLKLLELQKNSGRYNRGPGTATHCSTAQRSAPPKRLALLPGMQGILAIFITKLISLFVTFLCLILLRYLSRHVFYEYL